MIHMHELVIITLVIAAAAAGAIVAILTVISVGTRREKKARSFTTDSPSRAASATRLLNGYYARTPGMAAKWPGPSWSPEAGAPEPIRR
jgi:hypothetical protein